MLFKRMYLVTGFNGKLVRELGRFKAENDEAATKIFWEEYASIMSQLRKPQYEDLDLYRINFLGKNIFITSDA